MAYCYLKSFQTSSLLCAPLRFAADDSPDIIGRIEKFLAQAVGSDGGSNRPNINQVLVNEYHPGQGISVRAAESKAEV